MSKKEGKELATVKVYLNTGIIAGLIGVGFIASTLIFAFPCFSVDLKGMSAITNSKN